MIKMSLLESAIYDRAPNVDGDRLALIMLPGAMNTPQQMVENGFISALRERRLPVDVFALDAHADFYLERSQIRCLLHEALDAVKARGYSRIWLLGISLGGLGSMICATQRAADIEGVLLLAPYLGMRGLVAEVTAAGGLQNWKPDVGDDYERAFLAELQAYPFHESNSPRIYLGYGCEDRFLAASKLLAEYLPQERVLAMTGGHEWETWRRLWNGLLDQQPFGIPSSLP